MKEFDTTGGTSVRKSIVAAALCAYLALTIAGAGAAAVRSGAVSERPFFTFNPALSRNLFPWLVWDPGTGGVPTSSSPSGCLLCPGTVRVISDPLGSGGRVVEETTTPASHASDAPNSDSVYLYNGSHDWFGINNEADWIHFRVMVPSPGWNPYGGQLGGDPAMFETHNDSHVATWSARGYDMSHESAELTLGVNTWNRAPNGVRKPQLALRVLGGEAWNPLNYNQSWYFAGPLQFNHWCDILLYIKWGSTPSTGALRLWINGAEIRKRRYMDYGLRWVGASTDPRQPTLWKRPDGSYDHPIFELVNYHPGISTNSTVYYGRFSIGPTRASTAFR